MGVTINKAVIKAIIGGFNSVKISQRVILNSRFKKYKQINAFTKAVSNIANATPLIP